MREWETFLFQTNAPILPVSLFNLLVLVPVLVLVLVRAPRHRAENENGASWEAPSRSRDVRASQPPDGWKMNG